MLPNRATVQPQYVNINVVNSDVPLTRQYLAKRFVIPITL